MIAHYKELLQSSSDAATRANYTSEIEKLLGTMQSLFRPEVPSFSTIASAVPIAEVQHLTAPVPLPSSYRSPTTGQEPTNSEHRSKTESKKRAKKRTPVQIELAREQTKQNSCKVQLQKSP